MSSSSEKIWSSMIAARQLSNTYYTLSTCITDFLHQYIAISSPLANNITSSLFHKLDQTLYSSSSPTNQSKLLDEYSSILLNILKQSSIHNNIIQNVRRLFRLDSILKELFSVELNEHCECQECECTISNSITDVIHEVGEIRATLLSESSQLTCTCFRCGDQSQVKAVAFKKLSPCLALSISHLNANATDQLIDVHGVTYELCYIIQFDSALRSVVNVYLRQNTEFIKVDGQDALDRTTTLNIPGKCLTLWLSRSSSKPTSSPTAVVSVASHESQPSISVSQPSISVKDIPQASEPSSTTSETSAIASTVVQDHSYLSPPQSSASSQIITTHDDTTPNELTNTLTLDDMLLPSESIPITATTNDIPIEHKFPDDDDENFWNSLTEQSTPVVSENMSTSNHDEISDLYLTLLHSTKKDKTPVKSRADHDRAVSMLASDVLWPMILDQTSRRVDDKKSSSSTTTVGSISSNSSAASSTTKKNSMKSLTSIINSRRSHPYMKP